MIMVPIPSEITKGEELVVIPKKLYEQFLHALKSRTGLLSTTKLPKDLKDALLDVKKGRIEGSFLTLKEGLSALKKS